MEIIVAEDEDNLRTALRLAFERETWTVRDFPDGQAAWDFLQAPAEGGADRVLVVDITMPRMDGLELCRRVRTVDPEVPLLFLSSRDEEFDRVLGLELGADDYLCKPFSVRELLARIRVLHRRSHGRRLADGSAAAGGTETRGPGGAVRSAPAENGLAIDEQAFRAWWKGQELRLTVSEFRILASLAARPGTVKTREQLQLAAYPDDAYISQRAVDCHIKRLRRKMSTGGGGEGGVGGDASDMDRDSPIEAVYGLGYRLAL